MKYTIEVTAEDIAQDIAQGSTALPRHRNCAVARAAARALGFTVDVTNVLYRSHETEPLAVLPAPALEFIRDLDNGGQVSPFSFEVEF